MTSERILDFEPVHSGWSKFGIATVRLADGTVVKREIEDHGSAAAVLPYDPESRSALLITQFRAPVAQAGAAARLLEVPAGIVEQESPMECVRREALEEVGVELAELDAVAVAFPMPGISTERMHLFLAPFGPQQRVGSGGGMAHENESLEVVELGLDELADLADRGELADLKTLTLVLALRLRRPELFRSASK